MNEEEIKQSLSSGISNCDIQMMVDGSRLVLRLVSEDFAGLNRVKRQQKVYGLLNDKISSGEIHAVSMTCLTSEEAQSAT